MAGDRRRVRRPRGAAFLAANAAAYATGVARSHGAHHLQRVTRRAEGGVDHGPDASRQGDEGTGIVFAKHDPITVVIGGVTRPAGLSRRTKDRDVFPANTFGAEADRSPAWPDSD